MLVSVWFLDVQPAWWAPFSRSLVLPTLGWNLFIRGEPCLICCGSGRVQFGDRAATIFPGIESLSEARIKLVEIQS